MSEARDRAWYVEQGRLGGLRSAAARRAASKHKRSVCVCLTEEQLAFLDALARRSGHRHRSLVLEEAIEHYREHLTQLWLEAKQRKRPRVGAKPSSSVVGRRSKQA
jgi:predicted DNA-binding protein